MSSVSTCYARNATLMAVRRHKLHRKSWLNQARLEPCMPMGPRHKGEDDSHLCGKAQCLDYIADCYGSSVTTSTRRGASM